ncbi:MAG TPA: hypothetical protein VLA37_10530 [Sphingomonadaceae bacterium]|nr:hypothetical protein [Sphingomonadaceae bacterium]
MSQNFEFFDERAKAAAMEAEKATLENVRERARRSEAAWRQMADRALMIEKDRKIAEKVKAERIAAEREKVAG